MKEFQNTHLRIKVEKARERGERKNLKKRVRVVRRKAVGAKRKATEQAKDVLLVLPEIQVDPTTTKECLSHQRF